MKWTHVYPLNDLIKHDVGDFYDGYACRCDPKVDLGLNLIVHHAMDGRSVFEKQERI